MILNIIILPCWPRCAEGRRQWQLAVSTVVTVSPSVPMSPDLIIVACCLQSVLLALPSPPQLSASDARPKDQWSRRLPNHLLLPLHVVLDQLLLRFLCPLFVSVWTRFPFTFVQHARWVEANGTANDWRCSLIARKAVASAVAATGRNSLICS